MDNPQFECAVCTETKSFSEFPPKWLTLSCLHPPTTCVDCVSASVNAQFETNPSTRLSCPECPHSLGMDEIRMYLSEQNYSRYIRLFIENIALHVRNIVWCPFGCGTSQTHSSGQQQPIVLCRNCDRQFCYVHGVEWHREHTCDEYDAYLRDPTFRSQAQRDNDSREALSRHIEETKRRIQLAEEDHQLRCLREQEAAEARRIEQARIAREAREAAERAAREEARRLKEEEDRRVAQLEADDRLGSETVSANATRCPTCKIPVQRIDGW
ncbi:hypothetical protein diail_7643 [Diaporthe ilicicola]|nr:hypothetical protein diail_7643 [Diaporthe ilicicola]